MELFHIHLLGMHDEDYKPNSEFIVNPNEFNNRLYNRVMYTSYSVPIDNYKNLVRIMNEINKSLRIHMIKDFVNFSDILAMVDRFGTTEEKIHALEDAKKLMYKASFAKRELSIEDYRREYASDKPSRLHSLFACSEEGLDYWSYQIIDKPADIVRIETLDEPFRTNEQLLPDEKSSYIRSFENSENYFNPNKKNLCAFTDEYLVQGKVKILEKIDEIK